jgi:hypothetical protein
MNRKDLINGYMNLPLSVRIKAFKRFNWENRLPKTIQFFHNIQVILYPERFN